MARLENVKKIVNDSQVMEARGTSDTIRVWESHREQATLWRSLALIQIPLTFVMLLFAAFVYSTRTTILNVPEKPLPGSYTADVVPDVEFIEFATNYVNHVATYQYAVARQQFTEARKMLWDQMLIMFDEHFMKNELQKIETASRIQMMVIDPTKTVVQRNGHLVDVYLSGDRIKIIAAREAPRIQSTYKITLTTIPKNNYNPFGIVIINAVLKYIDPMTGQLK